VLGRVKHRAAHQGRALAGGCDRHNTGRHAPPTRAHEEHTPGPTARVDVLSWSSSTVDTPGSALGGPCAGLSGQAELLGPAGLARRPRQKESTASLEPP